MLKEYRTLWPYFKRFRFWYLGGIFFLLLTDAAQLLIPQMLKRAIDLLSLGSFELSAVGGVALAIFGLAAAIGLGRFGWRFFLHGASRRIEMQLRDRLFTHMQRLSSSFFGRVKTGDLMARFTNDMNAVRMASGMALVTFVDGVVMTAVILVFLFQQNPRLTLFTVIPLPFLTIIIVFFGKIVGQKFREVQDGFADISEMAQESISGVRIIKNFVKQAAFVRKFAATNQEYSRRNMALVRIWGLFMPIVMFLSGLTTLIFLLLGGRSVMEGTMSPGEFTAFLAYLQMMTWPMMGAGWMVNLIQRGGASLGRINRVLEEKPDITSPPEPKLLTGDMAVSIRNLSFAYSEDGEAVLEDVSFDIPQGSTLGILGKTGSGKSTLVKLLPRLLDPPEGTIFLAGRDVHEYDLKELRRQIGMVPQDTFLFSETIAANIAFARDGMDRREVERMGRMSTIDRDLKTFPAGYDTLVGERGITLSGGQKQRIAIARALLVDAPIVVLDDSLSSVDTETEDAILRALREHLHGKTTILISHRVSTLKMADQVVVLEGGRVVQQGSHNELIRLDGFYREIYDIQRLEEEINV